MKKKLLLAISISLSILAQPVLADGNDNGTKQRYQTANAFSTDLGPGTRVGAAWLLRTKNHVRGRIMVVVPTYGVSHTLWVVVFNNPSACSDIPNPGCDGTDLANPAVRGAVFNATGAISAADGLGNGLFNVDFEFNAGRLPDGLFVLLPHPDGRSGVSRGNGYKAEIHLVVDEHPFISQGPMSWIADLTETNFPGAGPAVNVAAAVFVPCPGKSCPPSAL